MKKHSDITDPKWFDYDFILSELEKIKNEEGSPIRNDKIRSFRFLIYGLNKHLESFKLIINHSKELEDFKICLLSPFFIKYDLDYSEKMIKKLNEKLEEFSEYEGMWPESGE